MTFCERCGTRYTRFDEACPGCGGPVAAGPPVEGPAPEPVTPSSPTDWLDDLVVLPMDLGPAKKGERELPHAHLQSVRDARGARVEVIIDNGIDESFPEPVAGKHGPAGPDPEEPEPVDREPKRDGGWFLVPDDGSRPGERPREVRRPESRPEKKPAEPGKKSRDRYLERAHGLEWQKEAQTKFEAEDGYAGPGSIRHDVVADDGSTWSVPSGTKRRKDER